MGFRFRRSFKLMPGVRMNISGSGGSLSFGGRGARINISSRGTRATVGIPGTGLSYSTSLTGPQPRRRSAQQLAAAHRRMLKEQAHAQACAEVERMEREISELLSAWRALLPRVPDRAEYRQQLVPAPFVNQEPPLEALDVEGARRRHRSAMQRAVAAELRPKPLLRHLWFIVALCCVMVIAPFDPIGGLRVAAPAGLLTWVAVSLWWRERLRPVCLARADAEWPARHAELQAVHASAVADYQQRMARARAEWDAAERERIAAMRKLLEGDLEAVASAATQAIEELDFPFEAECAVAADDEDHVIIDVDLPEIEDVIPETELRARKDGTLSEVKRKVADRNHAYAELACGIALVISATAFAAAPSVMRVTVAGRTQRAKRGSDAVVDNYVYEVTLERELFAHFDRARATPIDILRRAGARMQMSANGGLRTISKPGWLDAMV